MADRRVPTVLASGVVLLASVLGQALADVPRLIQYQGKLLESNGAALPGPVDIRVRLYDHPSSPAPVLFDETHAGVQLSRGLFSILIGSQTPGGVPNSAMAPAAVYLGVSIDDAPELAPRRRIVTTPYTLKAGLAEQLVRPGSITPSVSVDSVGRVGMGTTTPEGSAAVEIASSTGGFLPPRMSTAQRDAIANPATGLQVFNTTTNCIEFFVGGVWQVVACGCSGAPSTPGPIEGPTTICPDDPLAVYSVSAVFGATSYGWTVPPNAVIVSGQGTPSITVDFGNSSGNVIVSASNACGVSADRTLAVTVSGGSGSETFTTSGTFVVPGCQTSVRVLVVGGGGGGGGGHTGGGGSGHVRVGTISVTPGESVAVTVGTGGGGGPGGSGANNTGTSQSGAGSSFGGYLSASGGSGVACWSCCNCAPGGNGGSGGGGAGCCNSRTVGAAGGSAGSNGGATSQQPGGSGGNFDSLAPLIGNSFTAGSGGAGGMGTSGDFGGGGGGAGGVLINGTGPSAANGSDGASARGGQGYGAGGGAGGYNSSTYYFGGVGAPGVVYVEW